MRLGGDKKLTGNKLKKLQINQIYEKKGKWQFFGLKWPEKICGKSN